MNGVSNTTRHRVTSPLSRANVPASVRTNRRTDARGFARTLLALVVFLLPLAAVNPAAYADVVGQGALTHFYDVADSGGNLYDIAVLDTTHFMVAHTTGTATSPGITFACSTGNPFTVAPGPVGNTLTESCSSAGSPVNISAGSSSVGVLSLQPFRAGNGIGLPKLPTQPDTVTSGCDPKYWCASTMNQTNATDWTGSATEPNPTYVPPSTTPMLVRREVVTCANNVTYIFRTGIAMSAGAVNTFDAYCSPNNVSEYRVDFFYAKSLAREPASVPTTAPVGSSNTCVLSAISLVRLARGAGFAETDLQTAVAVALAESGGKVSALHQNTNLSWDIGLWQINDAAHPSYNRDTLFTSPGYNAQTAKEIKTAATDWSPWSTFTSGAYNKFMSQAATAVSQAPTGTLGGNSCADLSGGDLVPDPTDPNAAENGGNVEDTTDCGWTLNIFKILKCAFIPTSSELDGWKTSINRVTAQPPVSTVTGCFSIVTAILTPGNGDHRTDITTSSYGTMGDPLATNHGTAVQHFSFDPIAAAGDYVQGTDAQHQGSLHSLGQIMFNIMRAIIVVGFGYYWFNRVTASLGGKSGV